jgi:hypothetical protein
LLTQSVPRLLLQLQRRRPPPRRRLSLLQPLLLLLSLLLSLLPLLLLPCTEPPRGDATLSDALRHGPRGSLDAALRPAHAQCLHLVPQPSLAYSNLCSSTNG